MFAGDDDMDKQLQMKDDHDTIFHLKQKICTLEQKIKDLKYENEQLKCELFLPPIDEEGMWYTYTSKCTCTIMFYCMVLVLCVW